MLPDLDTGHQYFVSEYFKNMQNAYERYYQIFCAKIDEWKEPGTSKPKAKIETAPTTRQDVEGRGSHPSGEADRISTQIRRQRAMMASLKRLIDRIHDIDPSATISKTQLDSINKLWFDIESIHYHIWESHEEPIALGYNMDEYIDIEELVQAQQKKLDQTTNNADSVQVLNTSTVQLPKITIPRFSGNVLEWTQFYDIFSKMIDSQTLSNVQKMWYLKANISGEAEKLIRHLSLSEDNYETAWKLLNDRYNNRRIIATRLITQILDLPNLSPEAIAIKGFHDVIHECLLALNNLGIQTSNNHGLDLVLLTLLVRKLDKQSHILYEQFIQDPKEIQTIDKFLTFLQFRFQSLESISGNKNFTMKATTSIASTKAKGSCIICKDQGHPLYFCPKFLQKPSGERLKWVQQQKLCYNCLKSDHSSKTCTARTCTKCNKKHNTLLHLEPNSRKDECVTVASSSSTANDQGTVMLTTARVLITANNNRSKEFRAILDSGSQVNLVTERLVKTLGIQPQQAVLHIEGIGSSTKRANNRINVQLHSVSGYFATRLEAFVLPNIIANQPTKPVDSSAWSIPKNISMADPDFNKPGRIDVLLGAEFYFSLLQNGQIRLAKHLPILQNTQLGWVVGGKIGSSSVTTATCAVLTEEEQSTSKLIEKFWRLDEMPNDRKILSSSENHCEQHFIQTTTTNSEGRYIVKIPFAENPDALGESHSIAMRRFLALEKRLQKIPELKTKYVDFMEEYERLNHMQEISADNLQLPNYIIPHHCVIKEDSTTTKLRVVFDASAKTTSGLSLNDISHVGPTVQSELFSILLRFRLPKYVFTTDVEKMYRQILIDQNDQKFQTIIWRSNRNDPIKYYQLKTVTYGTASAPYLATKCLQHLATRNLQNFPLGAEVLQNDFYVDDGLSGSDNLYTALETQRQLIKMLRGAGFKLRKWCANHPQLLQEIPAEDREMSFNFSDEADLTIKTLGMSWLPTSDRFFIKVNLGEERKITKRSVSSDLAKLFDPLGIFGPVVVTAKIFVQQLWQLKIDWDEELPSNLQSQWTTYRQGLQSLNGKQCDRRVFTNGIKKQVQLHTFSDASERAYGAAVYIRTTYNDGRISVRLLCSKSRVAPLKQQTLPRLELCAALLAAELSTRVVKDLRLENEASFLWTDSEIVLSWINSESTSLHTFVANRISRIQDLTIHQQWRHTTSKHNPADIISRGISPDKLMMCDLWFYGPVFLHGQEACWPAPFNKELQIETQLERRQQFRPSVTVASVAEDYEFIYNINHHGSFQTLKRIVGYILRFIKNARTKRDLRRTDIVLHPQELNSALQVIVQAMQSVDFKEELRDLTNKKEINKSSALNAMSPFIDEKCILRVGGRLSASTLPYDAKHPMLLPYNDPLVKLLLRQLHQDNMHCGPQALISISRQKFWIIKAKSMARSIIQHCVTCTRNKPILLNQVMGNLPASRVTPSRPFFNTGVDYCGPFWVHYKIRGKKPHKVYIAVFCCFATKALHLEVVSDLTTDAFIGALRRFISRRGRCQTIHCDNATNFVGAKNQLAELKEAIFSHDAQGKIMKTCSDKGIDFKCIPPRAPHFGGLWEAAVKSTKHLLVRSVATASLTYEELETVIVEIEAILNSRPITPLSSNANDLTALTPGHFLIGEPITAQIDSNAHVNTKKSLLTRWKLVQDLKAEFWNRWSKEYLHELQQKHKWCTSSQNVKEGTLVIIKEDNIPVMQWPLGRITRLYRGPDDIVRVVDIQTASGQLKRPIHRLAPLLKDDELTCNSSTARCSEDKYRKDQNQPNIDEEVPSKRMRINPHITLTTILMTLLLLPLALSQSINITKFNNKPGLYFEKMGDVNIASAEWKIIVYYELLPIHEEIQAFINGTNALQLLCLNNDQPYFCKNMVNHYNQVITELITEDNLLTRHRKRRGAIDIVGNIAHSLFGVLDSNYANEMTNTIKELQNNDEFLLHLLKNQTSVINSTANIIKQIETTTKGHILELQQQVENLLNWINHDREQSKVFELIISLNSQLSIMAINLQRTQTQLLDVLTDAHHGKISPMLLTPQQLKTEIFKIKGHLPASRRLPIKEDELVYYYKILQAEGMVTENYIMFTINLPLVDDQHYDLLAITSIPTVVNKSIIAIQPTTPFLAVNAYRDQYIPLNIEDLNQCTTIQHNVHICHNGNVRIGKESGLLLCERQLFINKTSNSCKIQRLDSNFVCMKLHNQNQWIYSSTEETELSAVCGSDSLQLVLNDSGLISMKSNCVAKNTHVTLQSHFITKDSIRKTYIRFGDISNITTRAEIKRILNSTKFDVEQSLQQLNSIQELLQINSIAELPTKMNVNHAISYTSLLISILLIIIFAVWILKTKRCNKKPTLFQTGEISTPQPMPRRHPYTVTI